MIKELYQDLLQEGAFLFQKTLPPSIFEDKKITLEEIKKYLSKEIEKIILPTLCWQLYLEKSRTSIKGKNKIERFKNFILSKKKSFFKENPFIYKLAKNFIKEEVLFLTESVEKFFKNQKLISQFFNLKSAKITKIKIPSQADRHPNGKKIIFFSTTSKKVIKFNPYHFSKTRCFFEIIKEFNKENKEIKIPQSLETEDGWYSEFIPTKNKNISLIKAEKFYYQLGQILALIYSLNGSDFHMENLIAHKENPVILDVESLFTNFSFYKNKKIINKLEATGIIEKRKEKYPTSAIFGGNKKIISLVDPIILFRNTDLMRLKYKNFSKIKPENRIFKNNKKLWNPKNFKKEIIEGFTNSHFWIEKNKEKIQKIINSNQKILTRVIIRRTSLYALLGQNLLQPLNLPIKKFKRKLKSILKENSEKNHSFNKKKLRKIIKYEVKQITSYSIPIFWQDIKKKDLFFEGGKIKNFFPKSSLEILSSKLENINKNDLRKKIKEIEKSLK